MILFLTIVEAIITKEMKRIFNVPAKWRDEI